MTRTLRAALAAFALALGCVGASAQTSFPTAGGGRVDGKTLMCPTGSNDAQGEPIMAPCGGSSRPVNVTANVSASISGFTPTPGYATGTTSASDQTVSLPTGTEFIIYNTGSNAASFNFGATATGTMNVIQPGSWQAFAATGGSALHYIQATVASGTTTFTVSGGAGLPTGSGGGSSGSSSATVTSFQPNGTPLNVASVTSTSANSALPTGSANNNVLLSNYGGYKIIYQLSNSGATAVTIATADGILQPGATLEVAVGSTNTNIAYATTTAGLTASLQVTPGTGLWTGSATNNLSIGQLGLTAGNFGTQAAGIDNSTVLQGLGATAAGTSSTKNILAVQGVTGGVAIPISGTVTASFSQFAPNGHWSTPLTVGGTSASTALPTGGGTTAAIYNVGSNAAYFALGVGSATATAANDSVAPGGFLCVAVGSNTFIAAIETAGATTLNVSGGSGGCAGSGGGGGGGSSAAADTNLSPTGTISAANNFSTGLQVGNWQNGRVTLTGTPTSGSVLSWTGLTGWNSGTIECSGGGTQGTNHYSVVVSGPTGGTVWRRVVALTGPTLSIPVNLAAETFVNLIADVWSSGAPTCSMRVSVNQATPDDAAGQIQTQQTKPISFATGPTAVVLLPAVAGEMMVVNSAHFMSGGTTNFTVEYGTQTTNPCDTGTATLTGAEPLTAQQGASLPAGSQWVVPPGNQLCGIASVNGIQISGGLGFAFH